MAGFHVCPRHHEDYSSTPKNTAFRSNAKTQGLDPPSSAMTSPIFQQDGSPVGAAVISMDVQPHDRAIAAVSADAQPLHTSVLQPGTGLEKAVFYPAMAVLHVKQPASTSTGMVAFPAKGQSVSSEASFCKPFHRMTVRAQVLQTQFGLQLLVVTPTSTAWQALPRHLRPGDLKQGLRPQFASVLKHTAYKAQVLCLNPRKFRTRSLCLLCSIRLWMNS